MSHYIPTRVSVDQSLCNKWKCYPIPSSVKSIHFKGMWVYWEVGEISDNIREVIIDDLLFGLCNPMFDVKGCMKNVRHLTIKGIFEGPSHVEFPSCIETLTVYDQSCLYGEGQDEKIELPQGLKVTFRANGETVIL